MYGTTAIPVLLQCNESDFEDGVSTINRMSKRGTSAVLMHVSERSKRGRLR